MSRTISRVAVFAILVTFLAWIGPTLGGGPGTPGPGFYLWGAAPLLACLVVRTATRDWSDFGLRPAFARQGWWYLVSLLFFPVVMVSALLVASALSIDTVTAFSLGRFLRTVLTALPIFFVFAIFEEVGWRGYLAPKLASLGIGSFSAAAAVAIVWGSWHLPYIRDLTWIYSSEPLTTFIPRFYLLSFVLALVFGEIRMITGTFWPAVLMHAVGNAFGHPLEAGYVKVAGGREFLGNLGNGLIMIGLVAVLGVGIHRWRLNARSSLPK